MPAATVALANFVLNLCLSAESIAQSENRPSLSLVQVQAVAVPASNTLNAGHHKRKRSQHGEHESPSIRNLTHKAVPSPVVAVDRKPWWQIVTSATPVPYNHHFKFIEFVQRMRHNRVEGRGPLDVRPLATPQTATEVLTAEPVMEKADHSKGMMTVAQWQCCFVFSIVLSTLLLKFVYNQRYAFDWPDVVKDPELSQYEVERGRHCWNYCCMFLFFALLMITFWMTLLQISSVNADIRKEPVTVENSTNVTVTKYVIQDPGQRAFEAGEGIAFSIFIACVTCCSWRYYSEVRIASALLAQFILRGGTLAVLVALVLEIVGSLLLAIIGLYFPLFEMVLVGFSEEGAKMLATVCGVWIVASKMGEESPGCCGRCWQVLVERPRAFMLAGLAVGYGFMIVENVEYLLQAASTPAETREYPGDKADDTTNGVTMNFYTGVTIAIRVLLNIHPWLTGITAGRIASLAYKDARVQAGDAAAQDRDSVRPCSGCTTCEFLWAVWPSAVAHALYDFILVVAPILGIFAPPLFWYGSRRSFYGIWDEAELNKESESHTTTDKAKTSNLSTVS